MRNLLAFTAAVVLTVAGLGWYLGWYRVHSAPASDGHHKVNIDINTDKITNDIERAEKKILDDDLKAKLKSALEEFGKKVVA